MAHSLYIFIEKKNLPSSSLTLSNDSSAVEYFPFRMENKALPHMTGVDIRLDSFE